MSEVMNVGVMNVGQSLYTALALSSGNQKVHWSPSWTLKKLQNFDVMRTVKMMIDSDVPIYID